MRIFESEDCSESECESCPQEYINIFMVTVLSNQYSAVVYKLIIFSLRQELFSIGFVYFC